MPTKAETPCVNLSKLRISTILFTQAIVVAFMSGAIWMDLKQDIRSLGIDRWTKTDDKIYMLELQQLNSSLTLPAHERSSTTTQGN